MGGPRPTNDTARGGAWSIGLERPLGPVASRRLTHSRCPRPASRPPLAPPFARGGNSSGSAQQNQQCASAESTRCGPAFQPPRLGVARTAAALRKPPLPGTILPPASRAAQERVSRRNARWCDPTRTWLSFVLCPLSFVSKECRVGRWDRDLVVLCPLSFVFGASRCQAFPQNSGAGVPRAPALAKERGGQAEAANLWRAVLAECTDDRAAQHQLRERVSERG